VHITDELLLIDNRKSPPDNGTLLVIYDQVDYQVHHFDIVKADKSKPPKHGTSSSDEEDLEHAFYLLKL
jgi:hypothetical protein